MERRKWFSWRLVKAYLLVGIASGIYSTVFYLMLEVSTFLVCGLWGFLMTLWIWPTTKIFDEIEEEEVIPFREEEAVSRGSSYREKGK